MNPTSTKWRRSLWPYAIVGLLGAHVSAMMLAVHVASGSSGHTLLPEYYDRGQTWDEARAAEARSAALGWTLDITPDSRSDGAGRRRVDFVVRDAVGDLVSGASVTVRVYHRAVGERNEAAASAAERGGYVALLPMDRAGAYEVETIATLDGREFRDTRQVDIIPAGRRTAPGPDPARALAPDEAR